MTASLTSARTHSRMDDVLTLTKARISLSIAITGGAGYIFERGRIDATVLIPFIGTWLVASGCAALNQWQESVTDARMRRTHDRPIPAGRMHPNTALLIAASAATLGLGVLTLSQEQTLMAVGLGILAIFWYNGLYTPLKRLTAFAVIPGAVLGALPPLIGWTVAGGSITHPFILLVAAFVFVWQIPHFWLLLLLVGEEYASAGLPSMTSVFSREQLYRISFMWILATAATGMIFPALAGPRLGLPWNGAIVIGSFWLGITSAGLLRQGANENRTRFRRAFMGVNLYALFVLVCLMMGALGLSL